MEENKMILSQRIVNNDNTKENDLFKEYIINVENYSKTHIFSNIERGIISTTFKEYLYNVFDVSNQQELIKKINGEWKLILEDGIDNFKLNKTEKIVTIYYGNYKMFYYNKMKTKNSANAIKMLFNDDKVPPTSQIANIIEKIADRSDALNFTMNEKNILAKNIPTILMENNIKLDKDDIFDINKVSIKEVIEIGRKILKNDRTVLKVLGTKEVHKEETWQQYFERFGNYLLFGNVRLDPKICLNKEKTKELNDKYPDIITCNRFGFLDIIELKRSDMFLFKFDNSHNKLVPTSTLSSALSQLNGYLQIIPYAYETQKAKDQGLECASGMLLIGDKDHLVKENETLKKYLNDNNLTMENIKYEAQKELRKLNYSYSHMQVVLYDELIDTLETFINNIN